MQGDGHSRREIRGNDGHLPVCSECAACAGFDQVADLRFQGLAVSARRGEYSDGEREGVGAGRGDDSSIGGGSRSRQGQAEGEGTIDKVSRQGRRTVS